MNLKKGKLIAMSDQIEDELLSVEIVKVNHRYNNMHRGISSTVWTGIGFACVFIPCAPCIVLYVATT